MNFLLATPKSDIKTSRMIQEDSPLNVMRSTSLLSPEAMILLDPDDEKIELENEN